MYIVLVYIVFDNISIIVLKTSYNVGRSTFKIFTKLKNFRSFVVGAIAFVFKRAIYVWT